MRQYAIVGLGSFGLRMLEKLSEVSAELIIIDTDGELVEKSKDLARSAYIVDAIDDATLRRLLPEGLDVAIVDMGAGIEAAMLATNSLKKLGVGEIIVRADSEERGEILSIIGATKIVYPDKEAASRIVPLLVSPTLFSFMPIGPNLVMAEVRVPARSVGMSLIEANLRQRHGINVIAIRPEGSPEYRYFSADYRLTSLDILLVVGSEKDVIAFSGEGERQAKAGKGEIFKNLLKGKGGK
jgi:trk system potassium uptake protein TrkA